MDISKVDSNFKIEKFNMEDVEFIDIESIKSSLYGLFINGKKEFYRLPESVSSLLCDNIKYLSTHTSGGRILLKTNSPFIAIKGLVKDVNIVSSNALYGTYGFSVYEDDIYRGTILPTSLNLTKDDTIQPDQIDSPKNENYISFTGKKDLTNKEIKNVRITFPLYTGAKEIQIGVKKGSFIENYNKYKDNKKIVFYGSSITQGASASRSGLDYANLISEKFNSDFLNFGFAGNCKGELEIAEYIAKLDVKLFIIEYDHNAKTVEFLKNTHFSFYKKIREYNKNTPIIFISRPSTDYFEDYKERIKVIENTYKKGRKLGDKNVYFIKGSTFYGKEDRTVCTADTCHPNDIGFYRMYKIISSFIEKNNIL